MKRKMTIILVTFSSAIAIVAALLWTLQTVRAAPQTAAPHVSPSINYQGQLTTPSGEPVEDDVYTMTFRIYDNATIGAPLWAQTSTLTVTNGLFNVLLGDLTNPITPIVFTGGQRWLGIQVYPDPEMTPRQPFGSVPYALTAETLRAGGTTQDSMSGPLYVFTNNGSGPALVTNGHMHVNGNLTWYTQTSYISISPAAFQPYDETYQYVRKGRSLYTLNGRFYYAPIQIPDGTLVQKLNFCYFDDPTTTGVMTMTLRRGLLSNSTDYDVMAKVHSYDVGDLCNLDYTIDYAEIDNSRYMYWLFVEFDGALDEYHQVIGANVQYAYTNPH
jgi:hypothetical protein